MKIAILKKYFTALFTTVCRAYHFMFNFKKTAALIIAIAAMSAVTSASGSAACVRPVLELSGFSGTNYGSTSGATTEFKKVQPTLDGGYVVAGYSNGATTNLGTQNWGHVGGTTTYNAIILKFDSTGALEWTKNLGGSQNSLFQGVAVMNDGYVAVGASGSASTNLGTKNWRNLGVSDAIIVKFDLNGNVLWSKNLGGANDEGFNSVTISGDKIIAVGMSMGVSTNLGTKNWGNFSGDSYDMIIVELDTNGNVLWSKNLGNPGANSRFDAVTTFEDKIIAVGMSTGASANLGTKNWGNSGSYDAIAVSFDMAGNVLWSKNFGGTDTDIFIGVTVRENEIIAVGYSRGVSTNLGDKNWGNSGNYDAIAVSFDMAGNVLWSKNFGGTQNDNFYGCAYVNNKLIAVGGSNGISTNLGNGNWGQIGTGSNGIIVKFAATDTGASEVVLPNPGGDRGIIASYTADGHLIEIKMYDSQNTTAGEDVTAKIDTENAAKIKTFQWSRDENLVPKNAAKTYTKTGATWICE